MGNKDNVDLKECLDKLEHQDYVGQWDLKVKVDPQDHQVFQVRDQGGQ